MLLPDGVDKINVLRAKGTPEELDAGFIEAIRRPLSDTKTMLLNQAEYIQGVQLQVKNSMEAADKDVKKKEPAKKPEKPAAEKPEKKPAQKQQKQVKEETKKEQVPAQPSGPVQLTIE